MVLLGSGTGGIFLVLLLIIEKEHRNEHHVHRHNRRVQRHQILSLLNESQDSLKFLVNVIQITQAHQGAVTMSIDDIVKIKTKNKTSES